MIPVEVRNYKYGSVLSPYIEEYLNLKRACGNKYNIEAGVLRRFDRFCGDCKLLEPTIAKEIMDTWAAPHEGEAYRTRLARCSAVRGFVKYLNGIGITAALPPSIYSASASNSFAPYIFTREQVATIFAVADAMPLSKNGSSFHIIFPAILRVLYGCGLRISEALALNADDVDMNRGMITVYRSKNANTRQTPMAPSLKSSLARYKAKLETQITRTGFFFPNAKGEVYSQRTVYDKFREILWMSRIPHTGKGPRVHDLRHTFAVHALNQWVEQGRDCYILLPVLATYLGHKNITCTERYLRLTAEVFPQVLKQTQQISDAVIPGVRL